MSIQAETIEEAFEIAKKTGRCDLVKDGEVVAFISIPRDPRPVYEDFDDQDWEGFVEIVKRRVAKWPEWKKRAAISGLFTKPEEQ